MTIREGKWKCTYCDALNRGRDLKCQGCGATRERDVQFIYDETAAEVTDAAELARARSGPEWLCENCGSSNASELTTCRQCGAERGTARAREVKMVGAPAPPPPPRPSILPKVLMAFGAVAALVVLLIGGLIFYFTRTHEAELTVTAVQWQRSIEVEEFRTLTEQKWEDEVPNDARVQSRRREFHHNDKRQVGTREVEKTYTERVQVGTKRVKTGTKDLGNGYFEDVYKNEPVYENRERTKTVSEPIYVDVPVYRDKVTYQVDRWIVARTERAEGQDNAPQWPKLMEGPKLRAGKRAEKYLLFLKEAGKDKTYEHEVAAEEFTRFTPGATCRGLINNLGTIKKLELFK